MTRPYAQVTVNRRIVQSLRDALTFDAHDYAIIQDGIDAKFRDHERELFVSEGSSGGSAWAPLSEAYAELKRRAASQVRARNRAAQSAAAASQERPVSQKILRWTENMMRSLTRAGHSEHVSETQGASPRVVFVVGTINKLAGIHRVAHGGRPARDTLAHTPAQKLAYLDVVRTYVIAKATAVLRHLPSGGSTTVVH